MAELRLRRHRSLLGLIVPYRVDIGTARVAKLWAGQTVTLDVEPGPHRLTIWSGGVRVGQETVRASGTAAADYVIAADHQQQRLAVRALGLFGAARGSVRITAA